MSSMDMRAFERLLGGRDRAMAHDGGVAAGYGHGADLCPQGQAKFLGALGAHHQHGGRTIRQGGGRARGDGAVGRVESRLEVGQSSSI